MARQPRLYAAGFAHLVSIDFSETVQRSLQANVHQPYSEILSWLGQYSLACRVAIHGWSICPRSMSILATPALETSMPSLVQALGRKLSAQLKSGSVFAGRYHSTIPQPGLWVLPSLLWLELQPVREKLVEDAESWLWTSARAHTGLLSASPILLQPHPDYWLCGNTPFDRQATYRNELAGGLPSASERKITGALRGQWALGDGLFISELQKITTRRVSPGKRGRPKK
mgnify:CR=1 FL=1